MDIEIGWSRDSGVLVAKPVGRVYSAQYIEWQAALMSGIKPDDRAMVLDCEGVTYLSSAGLRVVLETARRFEGPGRAFALSRPTKGVRKVLAASGFDKIISIFDSTDEAILQTAKEAGADG